jgi:Fic family protein
MLHYTLSSKQQRQLHDLSMAFARIAHTAGSFPEEKHSFVASQSIISNIGASTRIENALLTDIEVEWMDTVIKTEPHLEYINKERFIKDKLSKDKERSVEEVAGYRNALLLVFFSPEEFHRLSISTIKGLHREMLKYHRHANYYLGDFKTIPNTVLETDLSTGQSSIVLKTADPGIVTETAMMELVSWYNDEINENPWTLAVAVELVFRFLAIHPFQDGNGRLSRLLFHAALTTPQHSAYRGSANLCAIDRTIERSRKHYYHVLRRCSDGIFNPDPSGYLYAFFLDYMIDTLEKSVENFNYYSAKYEHLLELSNASIGILDCFKNEPERFLSTRELTEQAGIPRRTVIYCLNKLLDTGFIRRQGKGASCRYRLLF